MKILLITVLVVVSEVGFEMFKPVIQSNFVCACFPISNIFDIFRFGVRFLVLKVFFWLSAYLCFFSLVIFLSLLLW